MGVPASPVPAECSQLGTCTAGPPCVCWMTQMVADSTVAPGRELGLGPWAKEMIVPVPGCRDPVVERLLGEALAKLGDPSTGLDVFL